MVDPTAKASELYSGESEVERQFLWRTRDLTPEQCMPNSAILEIQQKLCQDPSLAQEVAQENNERKNNCASAGGSYSFQTSERANVMTQRNVPPVLCKVSCIQLSKYICQSTDEALEVPTPTPPKKTTSDFSLPMSELPKAGRNVATTP